MEKYTHNVVQMINTVLVTFLLQMWFGSYSGLVTIKVVFKYERWKLNVFNFWIICSAAGWIVGVCKVVVQRRCMWSCYSKDSRQIWCLSYCRNLWKGYPQIFVRLYTILLSSQMHTDSLLFSANCAGFRGASLKHAVISVEPSQ